MKREVESARRWLRRRTSSVRHRGDRSRRAQTETALQLTLSVLVLLSFSCATGPESGGGEEYPDWYLDPKSVYPDDTYLSAVGSGDSRRDAEQQALAGLSQIFEARVRVDQRTQERYEELMTSQGSASESEVRLLQSTRVESNQDLLNVQFGETAVDESGRVHTIAYLERLPTAQVYRSLILTNADQVQQYLSEADGKESPVDRYAYLSAASVVADSNEVLIDQLRIIQPGMENTVDLGYEQQRIRSRKSELAQEMSVGVSLEGDEEGRITSLVEEAISSEFFPIDDQDPMMRVRGRADTAPAQGGEGFESVRWNLALQFQGPQGEGLVSYQGSDRASGVTEEAARSFAYEDMETAIREEFIGSLRNYFDRRVLGE